MNNKPLIINAYYLAHPYSGQGVYTCQLLEEFAKQYCGPIVLLSLDKKSRDATIQFQHRFPNIQLHHYRADFLPHRVRLLVGELFWIQYILKQYGRHALYFSPYTHPMLWKAQSSQYMTLHDAIFFREKAYQAKWSRKLYNALTARTVRDKKLGLLTVSRTSSEDIKNVLKLSYSPHVVPNGIDHLHQEDLLSRDETLRRFGITSKYLFYHGGYDARKNVPFVLDIFREVRKAHPEISLVLGGKPLYKSPLYARIEEEPGIIQTGFISSSELRSLYHHAEVFLSLSKDEGFNITIGEALIEHTPVIASNTPVHQELWQTYAILVSPTDLQAAVVKVLSTLKDQTPSKAPSSMTWKDCAGKILEYFT